MKIALEKSASSRVRKDLNALKIANKRRRIEEARANWEKANRQAGADIEVQAKRKWPFRGVYEHFVRGLDNLRWELSTERSFANMDMDNFFHEEETDATIIQSVALTTLHSMKDKKQTYEFLARLLLEGTYEGLHVILGSPIWIALG